MCTRFSKLNKNVTILIQKVNASLFTGLAVVVVSLFLLSMSHTRLQSSHHLEGLLGLTAVVDLQVEGVVGSAGWFSETGVETLGGMWFTGSVLS